MRIFEEENEDEDEKERSVAAFSDTLLGGLGGTPIKLSAEAKEQFCDIVALACRGKRTTITRHKKPVACVVPAERDSRRLTEQWRQRVAAIRLNRKGQPKLSISQLIQEGRK